MRRALILVCALMAGSFAALAEPAPAEAACGPYFRIAYPAPSGDSRVAHTFVVPQGYGVISRAEFNIEKQPSDGAGDWVVQLLTVDGSGTPTNTVLRSTTIPDASVDYGVTPFTEWAGEWGEFDPPMPVTAGEMYAIALTRPGASAFNYASWIDGPGGQYIDCSPGSTFVSSGPNTQWFALPTQDLVAVWYCSTPPGPCPSSSFPASIPQGDGAGSKACKRAKQKVSSAKKNLRQADSKRETKRAKKKLRKAKKKKQKICG